MAKDSREVGWRGAITRRKTPIRPEPDIVRDCPTTMQPLRDIFIARRDFLRRALLAGGAPLLAAGCAAPRGGPSVVDVHADHSAAVEAIAAEPPTASLAASLRFPLPDLGSDRVLKFVAGIRPFRTGRVRIETEELGEKTLIHNYGHGGAGMTLSWGSAAEVVRLVESRVESMQRDHVEIAVLGAGVIGLTAAYELLRAGFRVRIHAKATLEYTTSWLAGAQWAPSLVARGYLPGDPDFFMRLLTTSHRRFSALVVEGDWGVFRRPNLVVGNHREGGGGLSLIPAHLIPPVEWHEELPLSGVSLPGRIYHTMLIEPPIFLPRLACEVALLGGETEQRTFTALDDVRGLKEKIVVNCLGLGARDIVDDPRIIPMRGQLVYLTPQDLPYLLSHSDGYIFPRSDAVVLGGTVERGVDEPVPDEAACRRILNRNRRLFEADAVLATRRTRIHAV